MQYIYVYAHLHTFSDSPLLFPEESANREETFPLYGTCRATFFIVLLLSAYMVTFQWIVSTRGADISVRWPKRSEQVLYKISSWKGPKVTGKKHSTERRSIRALQMYTNYAIIAMDHPGDRGSHKGYTYK